jgi:hypothetical protein
MVATDSFAEFLCEQLAPLGRITMRRMFGKMGVFCDGVMVGMVNDNMLYFRVDDGSRSTLKGNRVHAASQLREAGPHNRSLILASSGAPARSRGVIIMARSGARSGNRRGSVPHRGSAGAIA